MNIFLGIDCGATKTGWGLVTEKGKLVKSGYFPTPSTQEAFLLSIEELATSHKPLAIGIGVPGTVTSDHTATRLCTNIPGLNDLQLTEALIDLAIPITVDNDARCALIGEAWLGAAQELEDAVLVTIGTGIGGAVMQKNVILPHPDDIKEEVSRLLIDPTDVFPTSSGSGTVEAFLGGRNLEERLQIDLHIVAEEVRKDDEEAKAVWHAISYYFIQCMRSIHDHFHCSTIIVGGVGSKDLSYYLQDPAPCTIISAKLGEAAAIFGAARLAIDTYQASQPVKQLDKK